MCLDREYNRSISSISSPHIWLFHRYISWWNCHWIGAHNRECPLAHWRVRIISICSDNIIGDIFGLVRRPENAVESWSSGKGASKSCGGTKIIKSTGLSDIRIFLVDISSPDNEYAVRAINVKCRTPGFFKASYSTISSRFTNNIIAIAVRV